MARNITHDIHNRLIENAARHVEVSVSSISSTWESDIRHVVEFATARRWELSDKSDEAKGQLAEKERALVEQVREAEELLCSFRDAIGRVHQQLRADLNDLAWSEHDANKAKKGD